MTSLGVEVVFTQLMNFCVKLLVKNTTRLHKLSTFSGGRAVHRHNFKRHISGEQAALNALNISRFNYNLLTNNCEHFFRRCHLLPPLSSQVIVYGSLLTFTLLAGVLSGGKVKPSIQ